MKEPSNPVTMNRPTDTTPPEYGLPGSPVPSSATEGTGAGTSRPEAESAAEERTRTVAHGSRPPLTPLPPSVRWVRVGDLLPQVTAAASGRGINLQTELASRVWQGSLDALRAAGRTAASLPQQKLFSTLARLGHSTTPRAQGRGIR